MIIKRFTSSLLILTFALFMACAASVSDPKGSAQAEDSTAKSDGATQQPSTPAQTPATQQPSTPAQPPAAQQPPAPHQPTALPTVTEPVMSAAQDAATMPFPIIPLILDFEYSPKYFIQWIKDNPQYSMIEGMTVKTSPPVYQVVLTEKSEGRRVYYSNSDTQVKILSGDGRVAHRAPIEFRTKESLGEQPTHEFSLVDATGQTIRWRFIPASETTERGGGIAAGRRKGMSFIYRKLGTAAGEGTAVQIGDKVINAEPWPQISTPPYFVAFRGAYSTESLFGGIIIGSESWQVKSAPATLAVGESWVLINGQNRRREFRILSRKGDELTIEETGGGLRVGLTARVTEQGLALQTVSAKSADRYIRITFKPALDLSTPGEVGFQIDLSGGGKAAEGAILVKPEGSTVNLNWHPSAPNWAKRLAITSYVTIAPNGYKLEVK